MYGPLKKSAKFLLLMSLCSLSVAAERSFEMKFDAVPPLTVTMQRALSFPLAVQGTTQLIPVKSEDRTHAARFTFTGAPGMKLSLSLSDNKLSLRGKKSNRPLVVDTFQFSKKNGTPGASSSKAQWDAVFDESGKLEVGLGATAHMRMSLPADTYEGKTTLRILYLI